MAGTSVLKLKVDDKEYNSSLKQATQGMQALEQSLKDAGKSFTQVDKSVVNYVRGIGQMEAQSKTARGRISEMSNAFVELSLQYKNMSDEVKSGDVGKALSKSMEQLKQRTIDAKNELENLNNELNGSGKGGGGLFSGIGDKMSGALQVFGGNLMTKGAGMLAGLASEMGDMVKQGIELAKQGEGIRIAFERLGRGDILDGLREATHGTVTDLELMKAAVKFNDFKLPIDELGTMLAFAQQKAKDTGQSVDYMVDSIVTGLGRKSLMILDNLGLSAAEIKDKMAETGDMTKAVGAIIREQMAKADDYVETAADRATQANVSLQNKMEELGRKFAPLQEASSNFWTSMKIGILDVIGGPLTNLLNKLTAAGRMMNAYGKMGGSGKVGRMTANLAGTSEGNRQSLYQRQQELFWRYINPREQRIKDIRAWQSGQRGEALQGRIGAIRDQYGSLDATKIQAEVDAAKKMLADYQSAAKQILQPIKQEITPTITTSGGATGGGGKGGKTIAGEKDDFKEVEEIVGLLNLQKQKLDDLQAMKPFAETEEEIVRLNKEIEKANTEYQRLLNLGKEKPVEIATGTSIQNDAGMSAYIASIKQQLETADYGTSLYNGLSAQLADMTTLQNLVGESLKAGLGTAMFDAADETGKDFWTRAMEGGVDNIDWQTIVDKINKARKDAGLDAIVINFKTGEVKNQAKEMTKDWNSAASAIQSVGSAMSQIEDPAAKVMGTVAQAIASIALGYAQATTQAASMGPWAWIAFAATGLATMISTISAIHSATGYAEGGIVQGTQYSGDNVWAGNAWVNSGELILNRVQQGVLADALSEPPSSIQGGNPYVSGENIFLGMNNYLRRAGYGELVTTKR